ncbi:MAG: hypothetical protein IRZ28_03850 [Steroidobacteraceae bacterium]|nr:hypothetical protein [Steroidobacteraceae bacterium]
MKHRTLGLAALAAMGTSVAAQGQEMSSALTAVRSTKPIIDLRLRSESVDQTGLAEKAHAVTLRGRIGFETGKALSTSLLVEGDLLWPFDSSYNSTVNGKTAYPVVPDPETYEINRLQLTNTSIAGTTLTIGRQRITLDDHRFVGNVGWRQNEQTFDAVRVVNTSIPHVTVDLSYIDQVNRVFGKESPAGRYTGSTWLANVAYASPVGKLTGFAYLLDFDESPADSSGTVGLRFTGERPVSRLTMAWVLSFARQSDRGNCPLNYEANYYTAELTGTFRHYTLGAGVEMMEGDGVRGFATPLATLHRFSGWADKFLTTPPNGLETRYVTLGYARKAFVGLDAFSASAVYNEFGSDRLGLDYGSEIDLQLQAKWRRFNVLLKYADYDADAFATDTSKYWAEVNYVW